MAESSLPEGQQRPARQHDVVIVCGRVDRQRRKAYGRCVERRLSPALVLLVAVAGATIQTEAVVCYEMRSMDVSARESARGA